ncbi:hypothetical protein DPMN_174678 [Dreissena polymorpha]|uniref:Uncharacterized protein n=1 Tax=Dreissena polymorpha TaxID=45954 RepID=A0A9D4E3S9_DREPO|nr:hypothetical protein DPMN_174678 [Dreissena polymorpha]
MVQQQLEMVFDIDVIDTQFEKLAESVLGQCVPQVMLKLKRILLNQSLANTCME